VQALLETAAQQGHPLAQARRGAYLLVSSAGDQHKAGVHLLEQAWASGCAEAALGLGTALAASQGGTKDPDRARALFAEATAEFPTDAAYNLAALTLMGPEGKSSGAKEARAQLAEITTHLVLGSLAALTLAWAQITGRGGAIQPVSALRNGLLTRTCAAQIAASVQGERLAGQRLLREWRAAHHGPHPE